MDGGNEHTLSSRTTIQFHRADDTTETQSSSTTSRTGGQSLYEQLQDHHMKKLEDMKQRHNVMNNLPPTLDDDDIEWIMEQERAKWRSQKSESEEERVHMERFLAVLRGTQMRQQQRQEQQQEQSEERMSDGDNSGDLVARTARALAESRRKKSRLLESSDLSGLIMSKAIHKKKKRRKMEKSKSGRSGEMRQKQQQQQEEEEEEKKNVVESGSRVVLEKEKVGSAVRSNAMSMLVGYGSSDDEEES